jgi:hypothetical protein
VIDGLRLPDEAVIAVLDGELAPFVSGTLYCHGVDGSARLDCPEVSSALSHSTDLLAEKSLRAHTDAYRACADRLTGHRVDLAGYSRAQQIDDFEAARIALGYKRIDLLSKSAGTRTAMISPSHDRSATTSTGACGRGGWCRGFRRRALAGRPRGRRRRGWPGRR